MPIRRHLAAVAGAGLLIPGIGLALAAPGFAAPPTPSPVAPTPARSVVPAVPSAAPTVAATPVPTTSPTAIHVPAGNAYTTTSGSGASEFDIVALVSAGCLLAGGGTVMAFRRRA